MLFLFKIFLMLPIDFTTGSIIVMGDANSSTAGRLTESILSPE